MLIYLFISLNFTRVILDRFWLKMPKIWCFVCSESLFYLIFHIKSLCSHWLKKKKIEQQQQREKEKGQNNNRTINCELNDFSFAWEFIPIASNFLHDYFGFDFVWQIIKHILLQFSSWADFPHVSEITMDSIGNKQLSVCLKWYSITCIELQLSNISVRRIFD